MHQREFNTIIMTIDDVNDISFMEAEADYFYYNTNLYDVIRHSIYHKLGMAA